MTQNEIQKNAVFVCGNVSDQAEILNIRNVLSANGVAAIASREISPDEPNLFPARAYTQDLNAILKREVAAILIVNSASNEIDKGIFSRILIASSEQKPIFSTQDIPKYGNDEIKIFDIIPLKGSLSPLIARYANPRA